MKKVLLVLMVTFFCSSLASAGQTNREATIEITLAQDTNFLSAYERENIITLSDNPYFYISPILSTEVLTGRWWTGGGNQNDPSNFFNSSLGSADPNFAYYWNDDALWVNRLGANALGQWHIDNVQIDGVSIKTNSINYMINDATVPPVPEPVSASLFLLGAGALGLRLYRKKS